MSLLTIAIPSYNRARTLPRAIESVLTQELENFELLVVDDGSTDGTAKLLENITDKRIKVITQPVNSGVAASRNTALNHATGKYLAWLDSDDWALPYRFKRQLSYLENNRDTVLVGTWVEQSRKGINRRVKRRPTDPDELAASLLFGPSIDNTSTMGVTSVLRTFPFDEARSHGEDYDQWARILIAGHRITNLPEVLTVRNKDGSDRLSNVSLNKQRSACRPVYSMLLNAIGITATTSDLDRHYHLRCNGGFRPDPEYLDWAEDWLRSIYSANTASGWSNPDKLARVIGRIWTKLCWKGKPRTNSIIRLSASGLPASAARKCLVRLEPLLP